ncbi:MAG TPA: hypothetical protein VNT99_12230, partial [Methylomirabilota bacterium]|nr:hypothetical protein [Methylomirabilota bacterium]
MRPESPNPAMKRPLNHALAVILFAFFGGCSQYAAVPEAKLAFLQAQERPLLLPDVTKRLGHTEIGKGGPFYAYTTADGKKTVEFWMFPPPETMTEKSVSVEIAMVVERSADAKPLIIWPRDL